MQSDQGRGSAKSSRWFRASRVSVAAVGTIVLIAGLTVGPSASASLQAPRYVSAETRSDDAAAKKFISVPNPTIKGAFRVGQVITVITGEVIPTPSMIKYQWYRDGKLIRGADSRKYKLRSVDLGHMVKAKMTLSSNANAPMSKWTEDRRVKKGVIAVSQSLSILGTAKYGKTVNAVGKWTKGSRVSFSWYRNGKRISGASRSSLKLTSGVIGASVSARAVVKKSGYTTRTIYSQPVKIVPATITVKSAPKVSGKIRVGSKVTAAGFAFSSKPTSFRYQWYRQGKSIKGAALKTYRIANADIGKQLSVKVAAKRANHSTKAASSEPVLVAAFPGNGSFDLWGFPQGLYKATGSGNKCVWTVDYVVKDYPGFQLIDQDIHRGGAHTYVQIDARDILFETRGCGAWVPAPKTGKKLTTIRNGTYRVGIDVVPGTYRLAKPEPGCTVWTLKEFRGGNTNGDSYNPFGEYEIPSNAKGVDVFGCSQPLVKK
jgi:hypothetical protein